MLNFNKLKSAEKKVNIRLLSCEGEIINFLLTNGPSNPKKIVDSSSYSNVHIYNKLKDLVAFGVVEKLPTGTNSRYLYRIADDFKFNMIEKD